MAAPTKPWHFLVAVLFYAVTWVVVGYALSVLGHRFGWSSWMDVPFSLGRTTVTGIFWSVAMVATNLWLHGKREAR
jgi:hypothetical protein